MNFNYNVIYSLVFSEYNKITSSISSMKNYNLEVGLQPGRDWKQFYISFMSQSISISL